MAWYDIVHLDRRFVLTGSYDSGTGVTTWTLPGSVVDTTLDTVVLGPDFGSSAGAIVTVTSAGGTPSTYTATGSYGAGGSVIGRGYTAKMELTRPYVTDRAGNADVDAYIGIIEVSAALHLTGQARIRWLRTGRSAKTRTFDQDPVAERATLRAFTGGDASETQVWIESTSPKPFTCTSIEWTVDYCPRDE